MKIRANTNDPNAFYGQHLWKEILVDPNDLISYVDPKAAESNDDTIINEAHQLARALLVNRVTELAEQELTPHQLIVFRLWMKNKTYQEIGEELKDNYSCAYSAYTAISHTIMGIRSKKHNTYHGGIKKKLKKLCFKDPRCLQLIKHIHNLRQHDLDISLDFLANHDQWWKRYRDKYQKDQNRKH